MLIAATMFGQMAYTNINSDVTINTDGATYYLDLDNNGISDYSLTCHIQDGGGLKTRNIQMTPLDSNAQAVAGTLMSAFNVNDSISSTKDYSKTFNTLNSYSYTVFTGWVAQGNFTNGIDQYVGLRLKVGANYYYGWLRVNLTVTTTSASCTIKDYAYNTTSGASILAGQSCSPQAKISAIGPTTFCAGGSVVLTSKNPGNTLKYQWKKNNINIVGATGNSYTATTAGSYKVNITDSLHLCSKASNKISVSVPCKLDGDNTQENFESISELLIEPNPFSHTTEIYFNIKQQGNVSVQIFEITGKLIKTLTHSEYEAGEYQLQWDATNNMNHLVNTGIYFIKIETDYYSIAKQIVLIQ